MAALVRRAGAFLTVVAVLGAMAVGGQVASAQQAGITIAAVGPVSLTVDGVVTERLPAEVQAGSRVCVLYGTQYVSEGERWNFERWSHGPTAQCVTLVTPGTYRAVFSREVLVQVKSAVASEQRSMWLPYGVPLTLEVPAAVRQGDEVRFRFLQWSEGQTPYETKNVIVPLKASLIEVKWIKENLVTLQGPEGVSLWGGGWQADGSDVVVQAPDTVAGQSSSERLKFAAWETVGFPPVVLPNAKNSIMTLKVMTPLTLKATYDKQYYVVARNPFGTLKREWVTAGQEVQFETPPIVEVAPELERFVFVRWEGMEGLVSPKVSGVVDRAVNLRAVYQREVKIAVTSPYGASGAGWYRIGSTASVAVPVSVEKKLVLKDTFVAFAGYGSKPTLQVLVAEPITLTALYRTQVDLGVLVVLAVLPLGLILLWLANRWVVLALRVRAK